MFDQAKQYEELKAACFACRKCEISTQKFRTHDPHLFGEGNLKSKIVMCGMSPSPNELRRKKVFAYEDKDLFSTMLRYLGLKREHIYLTNVVKCATLKGKSVRLAAARETKNCEYLLANELKLIQPKLVVVFGAHPMQTFTGMSFGVADMCGEVVDIGEDYKVFIMIHPSAVTREKEKYLPIFKSGARKLREYLLKTELT